MDYSGLVFAYRGNRPLTEEEQSQHLSVHDRVEGEVIYQGICTEFNSTYMEVIDKYYGWKGWLSMWMLLIAIFFSYALASTFFSSIENWQSLSEESKRIKMVDILWVSCLFLPIVIFCLFLLKKELFTLTHYPVRLNRKTRRVHVMMLNGEVLSVPWGEVYWHIGRGGQSALALGSVRGHVLSEDGQTVLKTFDVGQVSGYPDSEDRWLGRHWEFMRRYMEEGPQAVVDKVDFCMPIAEKKESYWFGLHLLLNMQLKGSPIYILAVPLLFVASIVRWCVLKTQKIPRWPQEVEAQCQIEAGDPYRRDIRTNPDFAGYR
ncbi:MAG: hypothetical protein ING21_08370 [Burkholderiales bacterium]|jgi:hypothetical protein|nr:hypothetical protein [Burkholderiales bacterium]MCA3162056.1 hypothetical protein [Burkholderiales bacterium]MCA3164757.1 hypothetical protein [Burkholderiales bacterium]MCA3166500.1 hypothetical protein [Burkholderiales bacterium]MCA3170967.1 hypothetical protein [Burkholderiales bacterium]